MGSPYNFDEILIKYVGGFGWCQASLLIYMGFFELFLSTSGLFHTLGGFKPNFRCRVPTCDANGTSAKYHQEWFDQTQDENFWINPQCQLAVQEDGEPVAWCEMDLQSQDHENLQNLSTIPCQEWVFERVPFTETLATEFNLVCSKDTFVGMLGSLYMIGLLIGSLIGGFFSDKFGRKKVVVFSAFLTGPLFFGQAFVPNYYTYAGLRLTGVVVTCLATFATFPLKLEMVSHQYRRYIMLLRDLQMTTGSLMLGGLAYFIRDWRTLQMICGAPLLVQPLLYFVIPESISWLVSTGNYQGAVQTLKNAAKKNGKTNVDHDEAQLLISGMAQQIEAEEKEKNTGCLQLLSQKQLRSNLLVMIINWSAVTIAWYGLALNIDILSGDIILNFAFMALVELPASLFGFMLLGCTGRKQTFMFCQLGSGLSCIASGMISDPFIRSFISFMDPWQLQNILCFVGKFFATMSFSVCYLFTMELFPTRVRSTSMGTCSALARIFGAATPYVKHLGIVWLPMPLVTIGAPSILGGLLVAFLPETRGRGLPESAQQAANLNQQTKCT